MRTVRLNGELGKRFGRVHRLDVASPAEAIRALSVNCEGFRQFLVESGERGLAYRCIVDGDRIDEGQIGNPMSRTFSITPVVMGGGKAFGIILGVTLLVGAMALSGGFAAIGAGGASFGATMGTSVGFLGLTYANVAWLGAALILGGVAQLMAPTPKAGGTSGERNENQYFNGPVNTTAQGAAVPIGYGRAIVGSAVISASVSVEEKPAFDYFIPDFGDFGNYY